MLTKRRQKVLTALIDEYMTSASPVGSLCLAENYLKEVSAATIRHELMELVTAGYAASPHASAGRIPTSRGYRVFVDNIILRSDYHYSTFVGALRSLQSPSELDSLDSQQRISKVLSHISDNTGLLSMLWTFRPDSSVHYRGLPMLLKQPEFHTSEMLIPLMQLLEDESMMHQLFLATLHNKGFTVHIGAEESLNEMVAYSVVAQVIGSKQPRGLLAVFGPTRMDYRKVIPCVFRAARLLGYSRI